jgi:hypothetical protein
MKQEGVHFTCHWAPSSEVLQKSFCVTCCLTTLPQAQTVWRQTVRKGKGKCTKREVHSITCHEGTGGGGVRGLSVSIVQPRH